MISFVNDLLDKDLCKNYFDFHIFSFFLFFKHDLIRCVDFTCIAAANTASDDVTSLIRPLIEYLIHTYYIFVLIL